MNAAPSESLSFEEVVLQEPIGSEGNPLPPDHARQIHDLLSGTPAPEYTTQPLEARVRLLHAHTFGEDGDAPPPEQEWLVEGMIPMGSVTFVCGDGGKGKSLLGLQLQLAAALGLPWLGLPIRQVPSVALYCEDPEAVIKRRAWYVARHYGIPLSDPRIKAAPWWCEYGEDNALNRYAWSERGGSPYGTTMLYDKLLEWALRRKARFVVLDSLHDVFTGNENYRPEAKAFVRVLTHMARQIQGAVIVLAHPSMTGMDRGSGTSGSTAWNNAVRSRLYLTDPEPPRGPTAAPADPDIRILRTVKSNYGAWGRQLRLRWKEGVFVAEPAAPAAKAAVTRREKRRGTGPKW